MPLPRHKKLRIILMVGGLLGVGLCGGSSSLASEVKPPGQGLRFVPPEELRGIPLAELPYAGYELPARVDLSEHMPPPGHQQSQNSCAAWASAYAVKTYQEKIEQRHALVQKGQPRWQYIFSPSFVYNQINQGRDGGATLVDALNLLRARGALTWSEMPYLEDNITQQPSVAQLQQARRYRIAYWRQVNVADLLELKSHVQAGYPVMVGLLIDQGFYQLKAQNWSRFDGSAQSGHAVVLVGYDDQRHAFKVMNSWGQTWGESGFGWVDYRHFRRSAREAYVAKDAWNDPQVSQLNVSRRADLERDAERSPGSAPEQKKASKPSAAAKPKPSPPLLQDEAAISPTAPAPLAPPTDSARQRERKESAGAVWSKADTEGATGGQDVVTHDAFGAIAQSLLPARLSGHVTLEHNFEDVEVILHFYRKVGHRYLPFKVNADWDARYRLPNDQLVLPAHVEAVDAESPGVYRWQAALPPGFINVLQTDADLFYQPVFYSQKFGVSRDPLYTPILKATTPHESGGSTAQ